MMASRRNRLYYLDAHVVVRNLCLSVDSTLTLWHKRLGHVGEKGLKNLIKKGVFGCSDQERNC